MSISVHDYLGYDYDDVGEECGPRDETAVDGIVPGGRVT